MNYVIAEAINYLAANLKDEVKIKLVQYCFDGRKSINEKNTSTNASPAPPLLKSDTGDLAATHILKTICLVFCVYK